MVLRGGFVAPRDVWPGFWLSQWGGRATAISRPGMLLNMSQGTGESPTTKNYPAPNISTAKVDNPLSRRKKQENSFMILGRQRSVEQTIRNTIHKIKNGYV